MVAITFRTDDPAKWGTGKGANLTPSEFDNNNWGMKQAIEALEASASSGATIDHFSTAGTDFYVHMSNGTVLGPYALPVVAWNFTGDWIPSHTYAVRDVFAYGTALYLVEIAHTSATTFDPYATNGSGQDYYSKLLDSVLPTGGAAGQALVKASGTNFDADWSVPYAAVGTKTGTTYTLDAADVGQYLRFTASGGCTITVPADTSLAVPVGSEFHLRQVAATGLIIAAGTGATVNAVQGYDLATEKEGATVTLKKVGANEWDVFGLLKVTP